MKKILIITIVFMLVIEYSYGQADPYSTSVFNYSSPSDGSETVDFTLGNGAGASRAITAGSVEWTLNFPAEILTPGDGIFTGTPFYEYGRSLAPNGIDWIVLVRNNVDIPLPDPFDETVTEFVISYPITGILVDQQGTMTINNRVLPGFNGTVGNLDANNDNASGPVIFDNLLPIELLSFTAESKGLDGALSWVTASEVDNDRFEVERSMDGKRFEKIGEVKGNGTTTNKQSYSFTDKGIGSQVNGRVYYRLNQVDYDGSSEASEVRYISFGKGGMSVYPNPTTGSLRIEVPVSTSIVKVYNSIGELVKQANHNSDDSFELSELVDGIYNIRVEDEQGEVIGTEKIVKIK